MSSGTVSDQIYARLLKGESPTELRKAFRSASAVTKAMQHYLRQTTPQVEDLQNQVIQRRRELQRMHTDHEDATRQLKAYQQETHAAETAIAKQRKQQRQLDTKIKSQTTRLEQIQGELATATKRLRELRAQGTSPELIARIYQMEARTSSDLLASVQTAHDVHQTQQTLKMLQHQETQQNQQLHKLKEQLQQTQRTLQETKNRRDEIERDIATLRTAIDVTRSFLEEGYSTKDLTSLREGLTLLQLPQEPPRSITRLVTAIQDARTLTQLHQEIQQHEATLATLQRNLTTVQGELTAYHEHVMTTLNATHTDHQQKFDELLHTVNKRATATTQSITQHINEIEHGIQSVRDHAAATGDAIRQLDALGPLLHFLDKGTGSPASLFPQFLYLLKQFTHWLSSQPSYRYSLKLQVDTVISALTTIIEREGWPS